MTTTYALTRPITTTIGTGANERQETVTELTFREPKVADLRALDGIDGEVSRTATLIGRLTGLTARQVDEMHPADFMGVAPLVASFFGTHPPTGGTSSEG